MSRRKGQITNLRSKRKKASFLTVQLELEANQEIPATKEKAL
jgi:hypothetical protein